MTQIGMPIDTVSCTIDEEEREIEHNPPTDDVYQDFQRTAG